MQTYLVGGAVRDRLLGLKTKDRDWVVVGAAPQELLDLGYQRGRRGILQHWHFSSSLRFTQIFSIPSTPFWREGRGLGPPSRPLFLSYWDIFF